MKFRIRIDVAVPAFGYLEVEAKSRKQAIAIVKKDIEENGWDSEAWQDVEFECEWGEAYDLECAE